MRPIDRCMDCILREVAELLGGVAVTVFGSCKAGTFLVVVKDCQVLTNHKGRAGGR